MWRCLKCGKINKEDSAIHCAYCGAMCDLSDEPKPIGKIEDDDLSAIHKPIPQFNSSSYENRADKQWVTTIELLLCAVGAIIGLVLVIGGIKLSFEGYGTSTETATFGADFYTDIYKATKNTADNVRVVSYGVDEVVSGIKLIVIGIGSTMLLGSGFKVLKIIKEIW